VTFAPIPLLCERDFFKTFANMKTTIPRNSIPSLLLILLLVLLSIVDLAKLQAAEPQFRSALIGNGPKAFVNLIDTKKLMEKGERDALLMFTCLVSRSGQAGGPPNIPRQTPGSKLLEEEVGLALGKCRFIPATYNGERTDVIFSGTVLFMVIDGKPHLRIYANQSRDDVNKGNDFIAPQVVANTVDNAGIKWDLPARPGYHSAGRVDLSIAVDANGNQKGMRVILDEHPGEGYGEIARKAYAKTKWIPGFRNGRAVECTFEYSTWFHPGL
jgi:hypothetical protein